MNGKNHGAFGKNAGRMSNDRKFGRNASYSGKNAAGNDRNFEKNAVYNGKGADANKAAEMYPLSLKDMCTIEHIHQLIEAGISSFKIEGRMKSKEYVAGVTAIYRKYIDQYYKTKKAVSIESQDLEVLNHLYIRSQRQDGYYFKHNGKDMVTLQNPAYASCEDRIIKQIDDTYLKQNRKKLVCAYFTAIQNEPITLCVSLGQEIVVTKSGVEASEALNRPMTAADFEKQLKKTGDTYFAIDELEVHVEGKVFVPVKEINALRRAVFDEILEAFLKADTADRVGKAERPEAKSETLIKSKIEPEWRNDGEALQIYALVHTSEQLDAVVKNRGVERIYLDGELFTQISTIGGEFALPPTKDACIENVKAFTQSKENDYNKEQEWYLALPYVKRARSAKAFEKYWNMLELPYITGVLVRSMDELGWLLEKNYLGQVVLDAGIYCWNQETKNYWENFWNRQNNPKPLLFTAPVELNKKELSDLSIQNMEVVAYGRLPMMISAGCIYKTFDACSPQPGFRAPLKLKDRLGKEFPVVANCAHCYNIIYNTTPLSLHQAMDEMQRMQAKAIRLSFTVESGAECRKIVDGFSGALFEKEEEALFYLQNKEYTNGHFKRGVE